MTSPYQALEGSFYLVNAFVGPGMKGNPCAVIFWSDMDDTAAMKALASDFNQPATAFVRHREGTSFDIRWFSSNLEIPVCGHGTVAAAYVLGHRLRHGESFDFHFSKGVIHAEVAAGVVRTSMRPPRVEQAAVPRHVQIGFHGMVLEYYTSAEKHVVVIDNEDNVRTMHPDWDALRTSDIFGYIITAKGSRSDMVSRVLLPFVPFLEDPATGSAHFLLTPFWAERLGKNELHAIQASERGGQMTCLWDGELATLVAEARLIAQGMLNIGDPGS